MQMRFAAIFKFQTAERAPNRLRAGTGLLTAGQPENAVC
jgi:hypothetical protein